MFKFSLIKEELKGNKWMREDFFMQDNHVFGFLTLRVRWWDEIQDARRLILN